MKARELANTLNQALDIIRTDMKLRGGRVVRPNRQRGRFYLFTKEAEYEFPSLAALLNYARGAGLAVVKEFEYLGSMYYTEVAESATTQATTTQATTIDT